MNGRSPGIVDRIEHLDHLGGKVREIPIIASDQDLLKAFLLKYNRKSEGMHRR